MSWESPPKKRIMRSSIADNQMLEYGFKNHLLSHVSDPRATRCQISQRLLDSYSEEGDDFF